MNTHSNFDWHPERYDSFAAQRQRPARDLVAAIPDIEARSVCDLGCGSGLSTLMARERWPTATITGVDRSPAMLAQARQRLPESIFLEADIGAFRLTAPADVIMANASLHWLDNHLTLLPALLDQLAPRGVLAVQMPNNTGEASHRLLADIAARQPYAAHPPAPGTTRHALESAGAYFDCLAPRAEVEIWETRYLHALDSADAIADWFGSTALQPWTDALPPKLREHYLADYRAALRAAYPTQVDGRVLLALPRLFIVARRSD